MSHADAQRHGDRNKRNQIRTRIERLVPSAGAHRLLWNWLAGNRVAGDDVDADIAGAAHEIVHDRAVQDLEPARPRRFADDDLGDVIGVRIADHVVGDAPIAARDGDCFAAQRLRQPQRIGDAVALLLAELQAAPAFDVERGPWRRAGGRPAAWHSAQARPSAGPR